MSGETGFGERVVITASDLAGTGPGASTQSSGPRNIPIWGRILGAALIACLPILCAFSIAVMIARRRKPDEYVWTRFLCAMLIASGLITSVSAAYLLLLKAPRSRENPRPILGLVSHDLAGSFPSLPSHAAMTPAELASRTEMLVFIVSPDIGTPFQISDLRSSSIGAAALLMADEAGYLLATNRHVAEAGVLFLKNDSGRALVVSRQGSFADADLIGVHRTLDLALLWVARRTGAARFTQPVARYADIAVGSAVYAIGHPQRLFFTLSSGLVSRIGGDGVVQISAPVSPGNSGGPAYDSYGNLLGLITSVVDKQATPNAENLNFATRADAFLTEDGWDFKGQGKDILKRFVQRSSNRND